MNCHPTPFSTAVLYNEIYHDLKADNKNMNFKLWMNDKLINFFSRWLLRTIESERIKVTGIMDTILVGSITSLFQFNDGITTGKKMKGDFNWQ